MASKSSRKLWAQYVAKNPPGRAAAKGGARAELPLTLGVPFSGLLLGIDPSLRGMGLAVVEVSERTEAQVVETRTLKIPARYSMIECLGMIGREVDDFITRYAVRHVAVEETIYVQNFRTAQILGAARGAAIAPCAMRGLEVFEYPPLRVKQSVAGYGRASKEQVLNAIRALTGRNLEIAYDEADAAAVAICHAFTWRDRSGPGGKPNAGV